MARPLLADSAMYLALRMGRMLARLGDLLRAVLRQDSEPESTLYEEMELTQAYVSLEQMRFGDRLRVILDRIDRVQRKLQFAILEEKKVEKRTAKSRNKR